MMEFSNIEMNYPDPENGDQWILDPGSVIVLDDWSQLVTLDDGTVIQIVDHNLAEVKDSEDVSKLPVLELEMDEVVSSDPMTESDARVLQSERERLNLPTMVEANYRPSEGLVIIARERIRAKTSLGKVIAPRSTKNFVAGGIFILKEVRASGPMLCLDTASDEDNCNWLCNVQTATSTADQNCEATQVGEDIYYNTTRDVEVGEELKVWYSEQYASLLGKSVIPVPGVQNMRTARSRYGTSKSFDALLLGLETPVLSRCRICHEYSSNLSVHICPALRTGKCPTCSILCPSLADHVCSKRTKLTEAVKTLVTEDHKHANKMYVYPDQTRKTEKVVSFGGLPYNKKRDPSGRGQDPEWKPGGASITKAKRGRGRPPTRVEPTGKRRRGRPPKYPLAEEATSTNSVLAEEASSSNDVLAEKATFSSNVQHGGGAPLEELVDVDVKSCQQNLTEKEVIDNVTEKSVSQSSLTVDYQTPVAFAPISQVDSVPQEETSLTAPILQDVTESEVSLMTQDALSEMNETYSLEDNFHEIYVEIVKDAYSDEYDDIDADMADDTADTTQCAVCMKEILDPEALLSHVEKHNTHAFCFSCAVFFPDMATFTNHDCRDSPGGVIHKSGHDDIVVENFQTEDSLVPVDELKVCLICETGFGTEEELDEHVGIVHSEEMEDLDKSMVVSLAKDYNSCDRCMRDFRTLRSLLNHLVTCNQSQLSTIKTHNCEFCPQVFACEKHLELHRKSHDRYFACISCRKQFSSEDSRAVHACGVVDPLDGLVTQNQPFCCGECDKRFKTQLHLNLHLNQHSRMFTCDICDNAFRKQADLDSHRILCKAEKVVRAHGVIRCEHCLMEFTDATVYHQHYLTHQAPFSCQYCSKPYRYLSAMEAHQQSCQLNEQRQDVPVEPVNCQHCFKMFSSPVRLKRHMVFHQKPQFDCTYCKRQFHRRDYYQNHMCQRPDGSIVRAGVATETKKKVDHVCPICGNHFVSSSNRNKHMLLHKEKQLSCDVCLKKFHLPHSLREHKRFVHSKKMEAQCPRCNKKLKNRACLNAHIRLLHNKDQNINYPCPVCDRGFNQRSNMLKHMLKHSTQKTFHCKLCPSSFRYPEQFSHHMIEHKDGKRYSCAECEKTFVKEYELRRHANIFHSDRVYACELCDFESRFDNAVRRHLKERHPRTAPKITAKYLKSLLKSPDQEKSQENSIPNSEEADTVVVVDSQVDSDVTHMIPDQAEESVSLPAQMVPSMSGKQLRIELDGQTLNFGSFELEKMKEIAEVE